MIDSQPSYESPGRLLTLSAELNRAGTVETAVSRTIELVETVFDQPVASVHTYDSATETVTTLGSSISSSPHVNTAPDQISESLLKQALTRGDGPSAGDTPEATVDTNPEEPLRAEVVVPVGQDRVLCVGVTDPKGVDETEVVTIEGIAANLETALSRIDHRQSALIDCDIARALFNQSDDATFVSDTDGTLLAVNRAAAELTGRDRETLLTNGLPDIHGEMAAESVREHLESAVTGASEPLTTTLAHAYDADLTVKLASKQIEIDGEDYIRTIAYEPPSGAQPQSEHHKGPLEDDVTTFRQLNELTTGAQAFDETVKRLLSLGRDHFGLDTGILSHVDGDDYEVDTVVDVTGTYEAGAVYDLGETMCDVTLAGDTTEPLAFADVTHTGHQNHPAAENVSAYIAAPVVVDNDIYGTVNFSMAKPRSEAFRPKEREFVTLVAQWIGKEIERRRRFKELERYETIVEAIDDPVYALDTEGRFIFLNRAAKRRFGYSQETHKESPSATMDEQALKRVRRQVDDLTHADGRSKTAEFELETANGSRKTFENRIAVIGDDKSRGTAGVLHDITARKERQQQLESFQQAIESSKDGVAVLDGDEFVYVDRSHVDMYGFENKEQLLGNTWRKMYDETEVERLEAEAFPALEAEGYWRGMVTGSRPDGSTFPAELSLTIVDDGRLVCTVRDETERQARKREIELKERAMNEAAVGIHITDPTKEDNPLIYVNDGFERMTGYTREEALGRDPLFLQGEDTDPEQMARLQGAIDAGEPVSTELRNERKDGTPYWSRISLTPVTDGSGAVRNFIGIQQDVTERRERSQWLQQFLDREPLMFIRTRCDDGEAVVESCSDRFLDRLGYDRAEIVGKPLASLYTADSAADLRGDGYEDALAGGFELDERTLVDADGESVHTLLRAVPRQDEMTGTSALFVDISERKERERQTEARRNLLKCVYEVTTDPELSFEEKMTGLLEAGKDHLDLSYGFLTRIEKGDKEGSATQTIVEALGSHELLQPGKSVPLEQSYCRKTIQRGGSMALTHAAEAGWTDDPGYGTFGLETYIGSEVVAGDDLYGTLCFASKEPREISFDEFERSFIRLIGRWAGYEIERRNTREKLQEQRERFELTLSKTNTGLMEWDLETDAVTWNETLVDIVGREVDSIKGFRSAIHPDDRDRVQQELETMAETGDIWNGEFRMLNNDGNTLWLETRATPVYNGGEEPVQVLATGTDISDRKKTERERRRNERRFESLFDDPGMLVGLLDTDGHVLDVNGTALEYIDSATTDFRGELFWETPWWNHSDALVADLQGWIQRAADGEYVEYIATHPGPDGNSRHIKGVIRPVADESGTVRSLLATARDVTERERQQRKIQNRQRKLDLVLSNTDTSVAELDLGNEVVNWTDMMGDNNIGSPETLESFIETVHPEDRERLQSNLEAMIDTGEPLGGEYRLVNEDDETVWVTAQAANLNTGDEKGDSTGKIAMIATEITDLKEREQELELKERAMDEATVGITITDPNQEDDPLIYVNDGFVKQTGYTCSDATGRNRRFLHADDGDQPALDDLRDAIAAEEPITVELRNYRKDGEQFWNRLSVTPIYDEDDNLVNRIGIQQDVTERKERGRELQEERERFRLLLESTNEYAFVIVGCDGNIQTWNEGATDLFGYGAEAALGMPMADLHPESDRESGLPDRLLQQARIAGESSDGGWRVRDDGSEFYADVRYAALETDAGEFQGYAVIARDMTDERKQRRRTEQFVKKSDDVVSILGADGIFEYVSGSADRVLEHDSDDLLGESLFDYLHPDDRDRVMEAFFTGVEEADSDVRAESRLDDGDGGWLNVDIRCRNMCADDAIDGMLLYIRDVTDEKQRTRRLEAIFNGTFQFTGLLEPDATVIEVNETALEFGGFNREDVVGKPLYDIPWLTHSEEVNDRARDAIKRAAGGEFVQYETVAKGAEGLATIDLSIKPVIDEGGDVSLLVVEGRDITAQRQQRQHLDVMQRVMRHNMRNDLSKVRGWAELLAEESDPDERAHHFETIERILDKWGKMTTDMERIQGALRQQRDEKATVDVSGMVEGVVESSNETFPEAAIEVETASAVSAPVPSVLGEALRELTENAIESTPDDDCRVEIRLSQVGDEWISVDVVDNGPGMPEMEADVLEHGEETPLNHGKGLGVWMIRMLIKQAGGDVSIEVTPDGTTVSLRIPIRDKTTTDVRSPEVVHKND